MTISTAPRRFGESAVPRSPSGSGTRRIGVLRPVSDPPTAEPAGSRGSVGARVRKAAIPAPIPQATRDLIADAGRALGRAIRAVDPADRYVAAHLAALRAAAAILAVRPRSTRPQRQASAWTLLAKAVPELSEWAAFFAAGAGKRRAAEAGIARSVTAREADDLVRQAAAFLDLVEQQLETVAGR